MKLPTRRPAHAKPKRRNARRRKKGLSPVTIRNLKTLLWLVLFFPVGLLRMWRASCTWKNGVKCAVTTLPAVVLTLLLVLPLQGDAPQGHIELVGSEKQTEIYGPELPENMVEGYSKPVGGTVILDADDDEDTTYYVYATKDQTCYHRSTCKFAYASGYKLTVYEATMMGYKPCNRCDPPVYSEETETTEADTTTETDTATDATSDASAQAELTDDPQPETLPEVDIINNEV